MLHKIVSLEGASTTIRGNGEYQPNLLVAGPQLTRIMDRRRFTPEELSEIAAIKASWAEGEAAGIIRPYSPEYVYLLRRPFQDFSLAKFTATRLRQLLATEAYIPMFGVLDGVQALPAIEAGMKGIYLSGWQTAYGATDESPVPDMSLYMGMELAKVIGKIYRALVNKYMLELQKGPVEKERWIVPLVCDLEAGFGHFTNAFLIALSLIEAGVSALHVEDQGVLKKCGHLGGKVVVPIGEHILRLIAVRLAADVAGVPLVIIARTDSQKAGIITSDCYGDSRGAEADQRFVTGKRVKVGEGESSFYLWDYKGGEEAVKERLVAFAPYADMVWAETERPDKEEYTRWAAHLHRFYPEKMLGYNCSPSFNEWGTNSPEWAEDFQRMLSQQGVKWPFITLAGTHVTSLAIFRFTQDYMRRGMAAFGEVQRGEMAAFQEGYSFYRHQAASGVAYWDLLQEAVTGGNASLGAMHGSTEERFVNKASDTSVNGPA